MLSSNLRVARREEVAYMRSLREKRLEAARKRDRKSFDAFVQAQVVRHTAK